MRADGTEKLLPSKCDRIEVREGDVLYFNTWGGGGAGDPYEREPERVGRDVARGLVTVEGARLYGVVCDAGGCVDIQATERLRAELRGSREAVKLFDQGGGIDEIKARCLEETGLQPPRAPVFARRGPGIAAG